MFPVFHNPRPQKLRGLLTRNSEEWEKKGHILCVGMKFIAMPIQKFLLLGSHHGVVKPEKEDCKKQQQPITLTGNDDSQRHEE